MREIKFRHWCPESKYMTPFENIKLLQSDKTLEDALSPDAFNSVLMQYTGLKDKNSKEIYEGDIVRMLYTDWCSKSEEDPRTLEQYLNDISEIGEIIYEYNQYKVWFKSYKGVRSCGSMICGKYGFIEVIGNIYENPGLLNK